MEGGVSEADGGCLPSGARASLLHKIMQLYLKLHDFCLHVNFAQTFSIIIVGIMSRLCYNSHRKLLISNVNIAVFFSKL